MHNYSLQLLWTVNLPVPLVHFPWPRYGIRWRYLSWPIVKKLLECSDNWLDRHAFIQKLVEHQGARKEITVQDNAFNRTRSLHAIVIIPLWSPCVLGPRESFFIFGLRSRKRRCTTLIFVVVVIVKRIYSSLRASVGKRWVKRDN